MGSLFGLMFGLGLVLIWRAGRGAPRRVRISSRPRGGPSRLLAEAGFARVTPGRLVAGCMATGAVGFVVALAVSHAVVLAVGFGGIAGWAPVGWLQHRRRQRSVERRQLWPDAVDNLASAVRAGMGLAEALGQLADRGPEPLRPAFAGFAEDYRATGRFGDCLDRLKAELADPVADRLIESLRITREVGGSDIGRLLRTLSQFLRDDARTRAELETRQGWTVNAARLAVAAPWILLALLSLRPATAAAYDSSAGVAVLAIGATVCLLAYRLMLRIARLPVDQRVLQ
ncbi:MAG TPA: type II secretion system F family protein [Mycobacteriales bacterium]|nr:type II secretion system F family protein [Mycobacteriales bacterium]